jgi:Inositol phospholipid synthesis and fat-storage-inducing TM
VHDARFQSIIIMVDRRKRPSPRVDPRTQQADSTSTSTSTRITSTQAATLSQPARRRGAQREVVFIVVLLFATVSLGSLYGDLNTTHQETVLRSRIPASVAEAIHGGSLPYFADKRNLFNRYFVKQAWGWSSAVVAAHLIASFLAAPAVSDSRPRSSSPVFGLLKPVLRWCFATLWWLAVTSWFFGPSLVDRVLVLTGAECVPADGVTHGDSTLAALHPDLCSTKAFAQGQQIRPYWRGGHDISGHVFLLVHAILFLASHFYDTFRHLVFSPSPRPGETRLAALERWTGYAALALMWLWWWMVLMTSLFFHRSEEKLSGFLFGIFSWMLSEMLLL